MTLLRDSVSLFDRKVFSALWSELPPQTLPLSCPDESQTLFISFFPQVRWHFIRDSTKERRENKRNLRRKLSGKLIDCSLSTEQVETAEKEERMTAEGGEFPRQFSLNALKNAESEMFLIAVIMQCTREREKFPDDLTSLETFPVMLQHANSQCTAQLPSPSSAFYCEQMCKYVPYRYTISCKNVWLQSRREEWSYLSMVCLPSRKIFILRHQRRISFSLKIAAKKIVESWFFFFKKFQI